MPLFNFKKKTDSAPCCCGSDCCTPEEAASENCCKTGDCCTPEEAASETCCQTSDCRTPAEAASGCCCGCCAPEAAETERFIKVLGGGCKNCHKLMENAQEALKTLGMDPQVELVTDPAAIVAYGVMSTPALVVDNQVVSTGRVLTPDQAAEAIRKARA